MTAGNLSLVKLQLALEFYLCLFKSCSSVSLESSSLLATTLVTVLFLKRPNISLNQTPSAANVALSPTLLNFLDCVRLALTKLKRPIFLVDVLKSLVKVPYSLVY